MRINELLNESEVLDEITRPDTMDNAQAILEKAGYKLIGAGWYADVYAKPDADHILKLFSVTDTAYPKFVNMTIQNPNIHFPKFKGKMMKVNEHYYAIRMEKLTSFGKTMDILGEIEDYIAGYANYGKSWPETDVRGKEVTEEMAQLEKTQPGITKACDLISHLIKSGVAGIDLHPGNLMMRGDTVVFTDPVA
jgi:hypothetical protein